MEKTLSLLIWWVISILHLSGGLACYMYMEGASPSPPDFKCMMWLFTIGSLAGLIRCFNITRSTLTP